MRKIITSVLYLVLILSSLITKAQLSSADSLYFQSIFSDLRYFNDSAFVGKFYKEDSLTSTAQLYTRLASIFPYSYSDIDSISTLQITSTNYSDSIINNSYNAYPFLYAQDDPLVSLPFVMNNKPDTAYAYFQSDTVALACKTAFFIVPGSGANQSTLVVQGFGYHNQLCYVQNTCLPYGDVFTFIKPNEDVRAIYWNKFKLSSYLISYLQSNGRHYGVNYFIEMIATIQWLKSKYDRVIVLGLSEGGYASLLAATYTNPHAAVISGAYSINFDSSASAAIFRERFDSLVDDHVKQNLKDKIQASRTQFLFTWGDNDPVPFLQGEHDSMYTANYFGNLPNCTYYYNYSGHTFPQCSILDSFIQTIPFSSSPKFVKLNTGKPDTLQAFITFCSADTFTFDLYRDIHFLGSMNYIGDTLWFSDTDTGNYYLKNIVASTGQTLFCTDTIHFVPYTYPLIINEQRNISEISILNPVQNFIEVYIPIRLVPSIKEVIVTNMYGQKMYMNQQVNTQLKISVEHFNKGIYYLTFVCTDGMVTRKIIKL